MDEVAWHVTAVGKTLDKRLNDHQKQKTSSFRTADQNLSQHPLRRVQSNRTTVSGWPEKDGDRTHLTLTHTHTHTLSHALTTSDDCWFLGLTTQWAFWRSRRSSEVKIGLKDLSKPNVYLCVLPFCGIFVHKPKVKAGQCVDIHIKRLDFVWFESLLDFICISLNTVSHFCHHVWQYIFSNFLLLCKHFKPDHF